MNQKKLTFFFKSILVLEQYRTEKKDEKGGEHRCLHKYHLSLNMFQMNYLYNKVKNKLQ